MRRAEGRGDRLAGQAPAPFVTPGAGSTILAYTACPLQMPPPLAEDPIVVLGAPRSGTTYLRNILDSHPDVSISNEVRLLEWLHRALAATQDDRALLADRDDFVAFLHAELPALVRRYYAARAPAARWWGDKNPHYAEHEGTLRTLASVFPRSRFVHIVRDPRAVVASLLKKRHEDGRPWTKPEEAHVLVGTHLEVAARFGATMPPDRYRLLRYEDLVEDDEAAARGLFAWLGIPFHDAVAQLCRAQAVQRTAFSGPTSDLANAGRRDSAIAAWLAAVPPAHQRESLQFMAPYLLQFGYETAASLDTFNRSLSPGAAHRGAQGQAAAGSEA